MQKAKVTRAQYAEMRGVSKVAVGKAINTGRISAAVDENGLIDVDLADELWAKNTNPDQGWHGQRRNREKAAQSGDQELEKLAKVLGVDASALPPLAESKTVQAYYQSQLAKLEFEEKSGRLIDMEKVKKQAFKASRLTRDAMLAIPDRVSAEIAGMTDAFEIHRKLMAEIRTAISEVTKGLESDD